MNFKNNSKTNQSLSISENENGITITTLDYLAFFGSRHVDEAKLVELFPKLEFRRIRQTHSDICVPSKSEYRFGSESLIPEADAHFTSERGVGLVIRTADCLPVMIYGETVDIEDKSNSGLNLNSKSVVFAIHAGWKGVANQITPKALEFKTKSTNRFTKIVRNSDPLQLDVLIGPHIQKVSFEVQEPTTTEILSSVSHASPHYDYNLETGKSYIDLGALVSQQLEKYEIQNFWASKHDTKTNLNYHSYRRDGKASGRNLSFICLLT